MIRVFKNDDGLWLRFGDDAIKLSAALEGRGPIVTANVLAFCTELADRHAHPVVGVITRVQIRAPQLILNGNVPIEAICMIMDDECYACGTPLAGDKGRVVPDLNPRNTSLWTLLCDECFAPSEETP